MVVSNVYLIVAVRDLCCASLCFSPFSHLLKGEQAMKDEDTCSSNEPPSTTSDPERGGDSDGRPLSAPPAVPQDAPSPAHPPRMDRQLPRRHNVRRLLVAMGVLVVLAGGYGVFRTVSPSPRQASSAFQQAHCPFP